MTSAEDKRLYRENAYYDIEALLSNELEGSYKSFKHWHNTRQHHPDRLKWKAYYSKKERLLNSLLLKLSKLSK